jgi:hypothetical protein
VQRVQQVVAQLLGPVARRPATWGLGAGLLAENCQILGLVADRSSRYPSEGIRRQN